MKSIRCIILFLTVVFFVSCDNRTVSFGSVEYYPDFLWVNSKITPLEKEFEFAFSPDAQLDSESYAELQFVDNNGDPVSTDIMQVSDKEGALKDNKLRVSSNVDSKVLIFTFSPDASGGKYQGYLKLISHNLDRIDSIALNPGDNVDIFQWTLHFNKQMNPLKIALLCALIALGACFFLWFMVIRPMVYPHFGKFKKTILIKQNGIIVGQSNFVFTGARKVVFFDRKVQQSVWNRLFIGEIKTYVNPLFKTKLTFSPKGRNAVVSGAGYAVNPNPVPRSGVATINYNSEKVSITLN